MATKYCWKLIDPQIGVSLWWKERDAALVAQHRRVTCEIERVTPQRGDVVSELGAPDTRISS